MDPNNEIENKKILSEAMKNEFEDRAFGCILGAFIGDSCGSFNEFNNNILTDEQMEECMEMPGGGPWAGIGAGQITDDSELAMCLL